MGNRLRVTEVFHSIQGEGTRVGLPAAFVRLTGCNLRCSWCDSTYTFSGGEWRDFEALYEDVETMPVVDHVCVTGGEPLLQSESLLFMQGLLERGYEVVLETGGGLFIGNVPKRVVKILDVKCPSSGEEGRNVWENVAHMDAHQDEYKFVLGGREDYEWARAVVYDRLLTGTILMSPVYGELSLADLSRWVLDDGLDVRVQTQLHKVIWGPNKRGV